MQSYSVADVASMLNVNEETVRRWIREGKLEATLRRGRNGSSIKLEDIVDFVNRSSNGRMRSAIKYWLNEHKIKYDLVQFETGHTTGKILGSVAGPVIGSIIGGPVGAVAGAVSAASGLLEKGPDEIIRLRSEDKNEPATAPVSETEEAESQNRKAVTELPDEKSSGQDGDTTDEQSDKKRESIKEYDKKILEEQLRLLELKQELARVEAEISIRESKIEYYKLLQKSDY